MTKHLRLGAANAAYARGRRRPKNWSPERRARQGGADSLMAALATLDRSQDRRRKSALRAERAFAHPVLPFAQTANAAFHRAPFEALGGFDSRVIYGGDLDFSWRLQRATGLRLVYEPRALVRHRHRTTWRGLFALYEKNAIANCLLARRYPHYAPYPRVRTAAWLVRRNCPFYPF